MPALDNQKKLDAFTSSIYRSVIEESYDILLDLKDRETEIMGKAEAEIRAEVERYKTKRLAEISAAESRRVTTRITENKRTLLQLREEQARAAFDQAREMIVSFTESDKYLPHLCSLLQKAVNVLGYGFAAEVILRPQDMKYTGELLSSVRGVSLAFREGDFTLGGLCLYCSAKGRQVDMSFDSALADMVGRFADMSGLRIEE